MVIHITVTGTVAVTVAVVVAVTAAVTDYCYCYCYADFELGDLSVATLSQNENDKKMNNTTKRQITILKTKRK